MTAPVVIAQNTSNAGCDTTAELIPELPRIMRQRGWLRAAALMENWQRNPANSDAQRGIPDIHTISMSWVLSFPRAARVFDQMLIDRIWMNEAGRAQIEQFLVTNGLLPSARGGSRTFGELPKNICRPPQYMIALHDELHIQTRTFTQSALSTPADELTAALANFSFHIIAAGEVSHAGRGQTGSRYQVSIRRIGIYVRDTYDFDDRGSRLPNHWVSGVVAQNTGERTRCAGGMSPTPHYASGATSTARDTGGTISCSPTFIGSSQ